MNNKNTRRLTVASIFCALAIVGSMFPFHFLGSKCAPVQHMVNILAGILLGPAYGVMMAFVVSLIRNLLGIGSLMAFPGSMFGALLCGLAYKYTKNIPLTLVGEVFGTAVLGGLSAYPIGIFLMGQSNALAFYVYIMPFFISTAVGAVFAGILVFYLKKNGILDSLQSKLK